MPGSDRSTPRYWTKHFRERADQRGLQGRVLAFVLAHGQRIAAEGNVYFAVLRHALPCDLVRTELAALAEGWLVVADSAGRLVTCFRRADAWAFAVQLSHRARRRRP